MGDLFNCHSHFGKIFQNPPLDVVRQNYQALKSKTILYISYATDKLDHSRGGRDNVNNNEKLEWPRTLTKYEEVIGVSLVACRGGIVIVNVSPADDEQGARVPKTGEQGKKRAPAG